MMISKRVAGKLNFSRSALFLYGLTSSSRDIGLLAITAGFKFKLVCGSVGTDSFSVSLAKN
jgi:hypothetical protein